MADQQNRCSKCGMSFQSNAQLERHAQEQPKPSSSAREDAGGRPRRIGW